MIAAMLENNVVTNIIMVDEPNYKTLKQQGYNLMAAESLGLEIGDYTEDGTMFYRDIPLYGEGGEIIGTERKSLPLDDPEELDKLNALRALGYTEV